MNIDLQLLENEFYHIYNRGNNRENLFYKPENYTYFLKKYDHYMSNYADTFTYCLLPNHFHLLVRIKPYSSFPTRKKDAKNIDLEYRVSEQFRLFFMSYAKAINIQEDRVSSLFQKNFKRKTVSEEKYFSNLVYYIHANPQLHGICEDFREYPYSSFGRMLTDKPGKLFKKEVIKWFGNKDDYRAFHNSTSKKINIDPLLLEE